MREKRKSSLSTTIGDRIIQFNKELQYNGTLPEGFAVLNPQWKSLNLYDSSMNRLTTQNQLIKPEVREDIQKNNVPQQSISR